jgi:DNA-directed RNA polymerase II subunit RPB11
VEVFEDSKIPNAATIKIVKQDHTLGNMLRAYVVKHISFFIC